MNTFLIISLPIAVALGPVTPTYLPFCHYKRAPFHPFSLLTPQQNPPHFTLNLLPFETLQVCSQHRMLSSSTSKTFSLSRSGTQTTLHIFTLQPPTCVISKRQFNCLLSYFSLTRIAAKERSMAVAITEWYVDYGPRAISILTPQRQRRFGKLIATTDTAFIRASTRSSATIAHAKR